MQPQDREELIDVSFQFLRWISINFPEMKDRIIYDSVYSSFDEVINFTPASFWGDVGRYDFNDLVKKSECSDSILSKVIEIVKDLKPELQNEILIAFIEAHMFPRPDSPLAATMSEALGMDLSDLC